MNASLVDRWISAVKPFPMEEIRGRFADSYSKACGLPPEVAAQVRQAVDGFNEVEMRKIVHTFAEEHFSEEALEAAVTFFESPLGQKYLKERRGVMSAAQDRLNQHLAESVKKAFGL